jgi:hypothetical protein
VAGLVPIDLFVTLTFMLEKFQECRMYFHKQKYLGKGEGAEEESRDTHVQGKMDKSVHLVFDGENLREEVKSHKVKLLTSLQTLKTAVSTSFFSFTK